MPPAGGTRTPLTQPGRAPIASYTWGGWGSQPPGEPLLRSTEPKPGGGNNSAARGDITQFRDVFQPDQGIFSPSYPLVPPEPERVRLWDFPVGYNTIYTPRSYEPIGFDELRALGREPRYHAARDRNPQGPNREARVDYQIARRAPPGGGRCNTHRAVDRVLADARRRAAVRDLAA